MQESDYPYSPYKSTCRYVSSKGKVRLSGYRSVAKFSPSQLVSAIAIQPVSIALAASSYVFRSYRSGIIKSGCGGNINHALVAIGYGTENGVDYWIIKNSWGTGWGESGYLRLLRTSAAAEGACRMLGRYPYYPTM